MQSLKTERMAVVPCATCSTLNRLDLTKLANGPKCAQCHYPMLLDRPVKATAASFDRILSGATVPVLVDLYADWCAPCRMMAPTLQDFAKRHAGSALVLKLDTDAEPSVAGRYGIRGIPTLLVFEQGRETGRHVGVADLRTLEALVRIGPA